MRSYIDLDDDSGVRIHPTAIVHPNVQLGVDVWIGPYCVVGWPGEKRNAPKVKGKVRIGDRAVLHEYAHIQSGIEDFTVIGDDYYGMAFSHVAHDCRLGDHVTLSTHATLSGHTILEDWVTMGMNSTTHQYAHVKKGTLIGAGAFMKGETGMWELWYGVPARFGGSNKVGWERYTESFPCGMGSGAAATR